MILCIGTTPAVQRTMVFGRLEIGQVNRSAEVYQTPAGKSINVAKVLAALGEGAMASGFLGGTRGQFLRRELDRLGIAHDFVTVGPETRLCITLIDRSGQTHTELVEEAQPAAAEAWEQLVGKLPHLLAGAKGLVLSGTLPPAAPQEFYRLCVEAANAAGVPTVLDARGEALLLALPARPLVVKPNVAELAASFGASIEDRGWRTEDADALAAPPALRRAVRRLLDAGAQNALVTMGKHGAVLAAGSALYHLASPAIAAVNTIGSGDAAAAGLAAGLARGQGLLEAARLGIACGAANALTLLSAEVRPADVQRLLGLVVISDTSSAGPGGKP